MTLEIKNQKYWVNINLYKKNTINKSNQDNQEVRVVIMSCMIQKYFNKLLALCIMIINR